MTNSTSLTRKTTTGNLDDDVELVVALRGDQRLTKHHAKHGTCEVNFEFLVVHRDAA